MLPPFKFFLFSSFSICLSLISFAEKGENISSNKESPILEKKSDTKELTVNEFCKQFYKFYLEDQAKLKSYFLDAVEQRKEKIRPMLTNYVVSYTKQGKLNDAKKIQDLIDLLKKEYIISSEIISELPRNVFYQFSANFKDRIEKDLKLYNKEKEKIVNNALREVDIELKKYINAGDLNSALLFQDLKEKIENDSLDVAKKKATDKDKEEKEKKDEKKKQSKPSSPQSFKPIEPYLSNLVCAEYTKISSCNDIETKKMKPIKTFKTRSVDIPNSYKKKDYFAFVFSGTLNIRSSKTYTFELNSDDGSMLFIDDVLVVNNDGVHALQSRHGSTKLSAGSHDFKLIYFEIARDAILELKINEE